MTEDTQAVTENPIETCDKCGEYQGTSRQIIGHKIHCRGSQKDDPTHPGDEVPEVEASAPEEVPPLTEAEINQKETPPLPPRRERVPFGTQQTKINLPPDDDKFHYAMLNDNWAREPDRIQRAELGGYEKLPDAKPMRVGSNDDSSSIMGIKMRIPQEYYKEDQLEKRKKRDIVARKINKGMLDVSEKDSQTRYVPEGMEIALSADNNKPVM